MKDTYEEIRTMIDYYNKNLYKSNNITELMNFAGRLSGLTYYLSETVADFKMNYNNARFIRKIDIARSKIAYRDRGETVSISDDKALVDNKDLYGEELEIEGNAYRAEILLRQVNTIIDVVRTRVSYLKVEQQNTKSDT